MTSPADAARLGPSALIHGYHVAFFWGAMILLGALVVSVLVINARKYVLSPVEHLVQSGREVTRSRKLLEQDPDHWNVQSPLCDAPSETFPSLGLFPTPIDPRGKDSIEERLHER